MATRPAKKNYRVLVIAYASVLVIGAESEAKALEYSTDECSLGDLQLDEARIEGIVDDDDLEAERRNADCVAEDNDDED